jgi:hypothetical protein
MGKESGTFQFKYTELSGKSEIESILVIETKDVVRSIGRFGESRQLISLNVKQLNYKSHES